MGNVGYAFSCEEISPNSLVEYAKRAEDNGFSFGFISDHFHPWTRRQAQSAFVWNVIGAISRETKNFVLATGVTCPLIRYHPAIVAQAAATSAAMMPGRFMLGLGTGENLNEHITGARWPGTDERLGMLEEAIEVIRLLWQGGNRNYHGKYYHVQDAQIFTLPDQLPPILVASSAEGSARLAGRLGDGLVSTQPLEEIVQTFNEAGGAGKPKYGQVTVCWAESQAEAKTIALDWWPNAALSGDLTIELPSPYHFEQACKLVDEEKVAQTVICGPDSQKHIQAIRKYFDAGFTHVYVHQVGDKQQRFMEFYRREVLPEFA